MQTYQLAVCDDRPEDSRLVARLASRWARQAGAEAEIESFPSAEAFLFRYEEKKDFDVLLLDIEMTGMDGVELARTVRRDNEAVQIVFITGYSDYIAEGYEVSALHYLMKPVNEEKFHQVLTRAVGRLARNEPFLTLELPGETVRVPLPEIRYLDLYPPGNPDGGGADHRRAHPPAPGAVREAEPGHHPSNLRERL